MARTKTNSQNDTKKTRRKGKILSTCITLKNMVNVDKMFILMDVFVTLFPHSFKMC